jgi:hypothetical protein
MRRSTRSPDVLLASLALAISVLLPTGIDADTWRLVNEPGFGNPDNRAVSAMAVFDGYLYVATDNDAAGSEIWKGRPGSWEWRRVTPPWSAATSRAAAMAVFNGHLYVGTDQGEIWRTAGEFVFTPCERIPFVPGCVSKQPGGAIFLERWREATPTSGAWRGTEVTSLAVFEERLFLSASAPLEVWQSVDGLGWVPVVLTSDGFSDPENNHSGRLGVFGGHLYVGTCREVPGGPGGAGDGLELWRTPDGFGWAAVVATDEAGAFLPSGFGLPGNTCATALAAFQGRLYVSTVNHVDGAQLWRFDGSTWEEVTPFDDGLFAPVRIQALGVFGLRIFAGRGIGSSIPPVWSSRTGDAWGVVNPEWPQENDTAVQAMVASRSALYVGTQNGTDGLSIIEKQPSLADRGLRVPHCLIPQLCGPPFPPFPPFLTE